jgi:transcription elongation factor GreB
MQSELTYLWKDKRPAVTQKVAEAAALGDRSENAEYIYGKRQLREIDARIQYLSKRLDELQVIDRQPKDTDTVYFGAWVTLEDDAGKRHRKRIVGADEIDANGDFMSIDAPLAQACIGKHIDDEINVDRPTNAGVPRILDLAPSDQVAITYHIKAIDYE